jgi:hypothetical protein
MYPLVWYDLTREQYSRSRGSVGDSIVLTKEGRRERELARPYACAKLARLHAGSTLARELVWPVFSTVIVILLTRSYYI